MSERSYHRATSRSVGINREETYHTTFLLATFFKLKAPRELKTDKTGICVTSCRAVVRMKNTLHNSTEGFASCCFPPVSLDITALCYIMLCTITALPYITGSCLCTLSLKGFDVDAFHLVPPPSCRHESLPDLIFSPILFFLSSIKMP